MSAAFRQLLSGPLARASVATSGLLALRVATQAASLLLLVRLFPPEAYGRLASASALAVVIGLIPGLGAGFVMLSRSGSSGDDAPGEVWRYAWPQMLVVGLVLLGLYLPAARWTGGASPLPFRILLWLGTGELLFAPATGMLSFALQARDRVPLSQWVQWMPLAFRLVAIVPCFDIAAERRMEVFALLQCSAAAVGMLAALATCRGVLSLDWRPRLPTRGELAQGANFAGMHLVASNASEFDKVIAVRAVGAHDAGVYSAVGRMLVALTMPVLAMLLSVQPRLFRHTQRPAADTNQLLKMVLLLAGAWGLTASIVLALVSPLAPLLLGQRFADAARLLPLLALSAPFLALRYSAGTALVALGRPLHRLAFEVCGILILAVGMFYFGRHWGLPGVVAAVVIAEALMAAGGWIAVLNVRQASKHQKGGE